MNSIFNHIFSKKALYYVLAIFIFAYFLSFINRYIYSDENWFGEEAYWLLKEGTVRIKSMPLTLDFDKQVFVYYKLFVYAAVGLIGLFGWSIWPLKFFVFALYILFLFLFNNWMRSPLIRFSWHQRILALFFLATTPLMIGQTFMFRPEIPMMLTGFLSFAFIHKGIKNDNHFSCALGAIFAGLSFLIHLNGNAIIVAGFIYLLSYRKWKHLLIYSPIAAFVSLLFFIDLSDYQSLKQFCFQLKYWPMNIYTDIDEQPYAFITTRLMNIFSEHQRFFWSTRVYSTSLLFLVCLIFTFKELKNRYPEILRYFLIFVICLNLLGGFICEKYLIYYLPFMVFIIAFTIHHYWVHKSKLFSTIAVAIFVVHMVTIILRFNLVFKVNYNHIKTHSEVLSYIPENTRVLAPWKFIYNGIESHDIVSYKNIEYFNHHKVSTYELENIVKKLHVEYIIVSVEFYNLVNVSKESITNQGVRNFLPIYSNNDFLILKKI